MLTVRTKQSKEGICLRGKGGSGMGYESHLVELSKKVNILKIMKSSFSLLEKGVTDRERKSTRMNPIVSIGIESICVNSQFSIYLDRYRSNKVNMGGGRQKT